MSRSENMKRIRAYNTTPELSVRKLLHGLGYRFRLHRSDLPGRPDVTLSRYRAALFVNGCFWHGHGCRRGRMPKSNLSYWLPKIQRNQERDRKNYDALIKSGWNPVIVWECEVKDQDSLKNRLQVTLQRSQGEARAS
ncbi:MAG: DNA mismatch endonuclease Vsr [Chloroflexi bacterium]|nr:DNA mismatch endonuclease Vsr [Chloroflexota bacterium]